MKRLIRILAVAMIMALVAACGEQRMTGGGGADAGTDFPEGPIKLIFPFAAGSPGDVNARALAKEATKSLGVEVQVVDRPGAAGTIGATEAVQAKSDGYTLGFVPIAPMTVQPQRTDLAYQGPDDYEPVIGLTLVAEAISVPADSPYETLEDLVDAAKSEKKAVAVSGKGTILDIDARLLAEESQSKLETVSYDGEQQLLAAMLGGTTDAAVSGVSAVQPFVDAKEARVLAVFAEERVPTMPDTPTTKELGYDVTFGVTNFIFAPKGTDPAVIDKLHQGFHEAWKSDAYQDYLEKAGFIPQYMPPDELRTFLEQEYEKYGEVVQTLDL